MTGSSFSTRVIPFDKDAITAAAAIVSTGGCVAMPTETVYGLAADAMSDIAVAGIYAAKGRPSFNPLIVHVADLTMAERLATLPPVTRDLISAFWPGALTLVLPQRPEAGLAKAVTAGLTTVAIRCPAHPAMHDLIAASGRPLAAPSANASGSVSPTTASHVQETLSGRIPLIIDAGPCAGGLESTIVSVSEGYLNILRPGPVTCGMLADVVGLPIRGATDDGAITAPGQLVSHYAPGKPMLLDCDIPPADAFMIGFGQIAGDYQLSGRADLNEAASRLFDALHMGRQSNKPCIAVAPRRDWHSDQ
jgi:L-threonylcarbamoyladenylate synthase